MENFDQALQKFIDAINDTLKQYSENSETLSYGTAENDYFKPVTTNVGKKYIKIVMNMGANISVYCFVNKENGDILKAASWNTPAKGKRGNIFEPSCYEGKDLLYGGWLYR